MKYYKKQRKLKRANTFVSRECLMCGKATRFPKYTKRGIATGEDVRQKIRGHSVACDSQRKQKTAVDAFTLPEDANKEAKKILAVVREAARRKKDSAILSLSDDQILRRIKKKRIWGEKIEAPSRNTFGRRKSTR
jgi:hypothetical protein